MLDRLAEELLGKTLGQSSKKERVLRANSRMISKADLGDKWPLTIDTAELCTNGFAIFLRADGKLYGVNGMAPGFLRGSGEDVRDLHEIWRDDPALPGLKVSVSPLFELAKHVEDGDSRGTTTGAWLRLRQADMIKLLLLPLLLVTNALNGVLSLLLKAMKGLGGKIVAAVVVVGGLAIVWLTTGILIKELWEAVLGLWQKSFWDHGVFFVVAAILVPVVLVKIMFSHMNNT